MSDKYSVRRQALEEAAALVDEIGARAADNRDEMLLSLAAAAIRALAKKKAKR